MIETLGIGTVLALIVTIHLLSGGEINLTFKKATAQRPKNELIRTKKRCK